MIACCTSGCGCGHNLWRMSNWLLKIHLFLFYSSVSCTVVYLTVYYKTFTDCSYHEIGILVMFVSLGGAILKPLICSYADRHGNYKQCLTLAVAINCLSTFALALIPFRPQLLFDEPHPRLMWYLVALVSFTGHVCLGLVVTLSDVFIIQECSQSRVGEHFGQYRIIGGFGWALSSISVALAEPHLQLPYLSLPLLASSLFLLIDLPLITRVKEISAIGRRTSDGSRRGSISATTNLDQKPRKSKIAQASFLAKARPSISSSNAPISLKAPLGGQQRGAGSAVVYATVEPDRLRQARRSGPPLAGSSCSAPTPDIHDYFGPQRTSGHEQRAQQVKKVVTHPSSTRGSDGRISFMTQLDLLIRLNRHDRHHLVKYLLAFIIIGAFNQIHYIFYFQYFTEILEARQLTSMLFTMSALIQVSNCVGETVGLLWVARLLIDHLGRDVSLMVAILISGSRAAIIGYLLDELGVWTIATLEFQTGLLYGISYTLMIECASSYLSVLDRLLLVETDGFDEHEPTDSSRRQQEEANFLARLEELKEMHSIESIRFAIRATVQGIFSGASEGIGFAIGPLLAGIWLSWGAKDSLEALYRDLAYAHVTILFAMVLLEFALMRLLLGSRSKIDRLLMIGTGQKRLSL